MMSQATSTAPTVMTLNLMLHPTKRQTTVGTRVTTQFTLSAPPTNWITTSTTGLFKISQMVTGGVEVIGRRISITPLGFGAQIAVVHAAALADVEERTLPERKIAEVIASVRNRIFNFMPFR